MAKFAVGVVDTGGKFSASVVDNGGKFAPGVVDTAGHLDLRIFKKIWNGFIGVLWGWGETDSCTKQEAKNLVTLSF